jgi:predicted nucleotide-binding protein
MKARFDGAEGMRRLVEALKSQRLVGNDEALAKQIADSGEIVELAPGTNLVVQGDSDNDLYFIIDGEASTFVNGRPVAIRRAGESIGEMAVIDPTARRSTTVTANKTLTVVKVTEAFFRELIKDNTKVWQAISIVIAERLRQRERFHRPPNEKPILFLGSSVEGLAIAQEIHLGLKYDNISVKLWSTPGVFGPGGITIDVLMKEVDLSDFAAFIFGPDDELFSRNEVYEAPRDNVVFELGLFMGRLDRNRAFIVKDSRSDIKIPTDLLGVTPITYFPKTGEELSVPAGTICTELRKVINRLGAR